ncbi:hypothetical protein H6F74_23000 [Trichocoleus sp. FACHB-90]|nr:hypothetical protein [Trichocoleus sp. FACHB-90]MBD1929090.1 hypothetical protein [Trichocoleus sp. FACHB-90]
MTLPAVLVPTPAAVAGVQMSLVTAVTVAAAILAAAVVAEAVAVATGSRK